MISRNMHTDNMDGRPGMEAWKDKIDGMTIRNKIIKESLQRQKGVNENKKLDGMDQENKKINLVKDEKKGTENKESVSRIGDNRTDLQ